MKRGRKPTPTALKVLNGNPGHRPLPKNEPQVAEPLGDAPADWPVKGKVLWHEIANQVPAGVATKADRIVFELFVRLVAEIRGDPSAITPALASQIRACAGCFGLTPADRARLSVPPERRSDDPAGEFFDD